MSVLHHHYQAANEPPVVSFTVRVMLHGANALDYIDLHENMQAAGFSKLVLSNDGRQFELPPAEYVCDTRLSCRQVHDIAERIANAVRPRAHIFVTEVKSAVWTLPLAV